MSRWSIESLLAAYARGLSPVAVVAQCLERIERRNGALRALIAVDADGALAAARLAEAAWRGGRASAPLSGVPVVVKDMLDIAGWPTTGGSRLYDGTVAARDAVAVARLKAAGAVVLGKTNLHELTTGGPDNPWFGKVVHPRDAGRGTGGSSSGSAAAVAAGFCAAALGTDSGGSNRSPAAATGLVGFKPSRGLVDTGGSRPTAHSLDVVGPLATTIADARRMTEALSGRPAPAGARLDPAGLVLALCPSLYAATVDSVLAQGHADWLDRLRRAGVRVIELAFDGAATVREAGSAILCHEFVQHHGAAIRARPGCVGRGVHAFVEAAASVDAQAYARALAVRADAQQRFDALLEGIDVLAVPTTPGLAPRLDDDGTWNGEASVSYSAAGVAFRLWANVLDLPTLAVPLPCANPMPASIQLAARRGADWALFDRAQALTDAGR